jgi:hypothetical protein
MKQRTSQEQNLSKWLENECEKEVIWIMGKHICWKHKDRVLVYEIWGSHSGEDVGIGLLGCNVMWTCK